MGGRWRKREGDDYSVEKLYREKNGGRLANSGGFLSEDSDSDAEGAAKKRSKAPVEDEDVEGAVGVAEVAFSERDLPLCAHCAQEFPDSFLWHHFGEPLCEPCGKPAPGPRPKAEGEPEEGTAGEASGAEEGPSQEGPSEGEAVASENQLVTRTQAKELFLLKDADLDRRTPRLRFLSRKNPHNPHWGDMKLYLRCQVRRRAVEVWGSLEAVREAREARAAAADLRKERQMEKKLKLLRKQVRGVAKRAAPPKAHTHSFGPETPVPHSDDTFRRTCSVCDFVDTYEKL